MDAILPIFLNMGCFFFANFGSLLTRLYKYASSVLFSNFVILFEPKYNY